MRHINVPEAPDWVKEENARLAKQARCAHADTTTKHYKNGKWSTRCNNCRAILASDATEVPEKIWKEIVL